MPNKYTFGVIKLEINILLSCSLIILAQIIYNRLTDIIHQLLRQKKEGFRPGRECIDHIKNMRLIIAGVKHITVHMFCRLQKNF